MTAAAGRRRAGARRRSRPRRSGSPAPLARGLLDAGWTPGAVVLVRLAIGALVVAPLAARALRGRWGVAARERLVRARLRRRARRRRAVRLLLGGAADGRRPGAADRVHGARRGRRLALAAPRRAPAAADGRRRRARRARPRARPRPAVGRRPAHRSACLGADRDGLRRVVLRARRRSRAPGLPPVALAGAGLAAGALVLAAARRSSGILPMHATTASPVVRGQRRRLVGAARSASASSRPGSPTAPGSRPAAGSARACPRSSRCWRSWPA